MQFVVKLQGKEGPKAKELLEQMLKSLTPVERRQLEYRLAANRLLYKLTRTKRLLKWKLSEIIHLAFFLILSRPE